MLLNLRALAVVLIVATAVFFIAKPLCLRFMTEEDFCRRRNLWFAVTVAAFASPDPWLFAFFAGVLLWRSARSDSNPVALYVLMLHMIPPGVVWEIPVPGINYLFVLGGYRIVALAVLVPAALRLLQSAGVRGEVPSSVKLMDGLLVAFGALQLVLEMSHESATHTMRRGFLFILDVLLLYYVVSRTCSRRPAIAEALASFCLACAIYAPLALFESLKGWLLYEHIGELWDSPLVFAFLLREGVLRAQVSAGHSIPLGFLFALAFGFWLYLRGRVPARSVNLAVVACMWAGMLGAYARAPWIAALALFFADLALGPYPRVQVFKALAFSGVAAGAVLVSPLGARIVDNLPFVGSVDAYNVAYRQRLAELSWQLIQENPFFGDPFFLARMESLRQGQGIIDLINGYAAIALPYGLVGLGLVVGFFCIGLWNALRVYRAAAPLDHDLARLGANLAACMAATLAMMGMGGFGGGVEKMFYVLAGLAAGLTMAARAAAPLPRERPVPRTGPSAAPSAARTPGGG